MKLRQAAVYLNYKPSQLRILVQQGQIPYLPGKGQNGAWRFDLRDLGVHGALERLAHFQPGVGNDCAPR